MAELNVFKETSVPVSTLPDAWYALKEGANPYFTLQIADAGGTLYPLSVDVLGTLLAGYSAGSNTAIASTDNVLQAFQKTQGQINNLAAAIAGGIKTPLPLDASANPNYPAAAKGDSYIITVAGKVGGASGKDVEVGDVVNALNANAGGTQAAVGADWYILQTNTGEASDTVMGIVRRATISEVDNGSDVNAYVAAGRLRSGVRATTLAGLSTGVNSAVVAGDTVLAGIGKLQAQVNSRVVSNSAITGATRTKITYDSKGLVTGGADLAESDIPALEISKITGLQSALDGKLSGSGVAGRVTFWNGTNSLGNSSNFTWDDVNRTLKLITSGNNIALKILNQETDAANKIFNIGTGHYTNAEEDVLGMRILSASDGNTVYIGGGSSTLNAATSLRFYSAPDNSTLGGILRWSILSAGALESSGPQTIRSSTGALTLATNDGNGDVIVSPHGTGALVYNASNGIGDFLTVDGSNKVRRRTAAQLLADIGAQAAGSFLSRGYNSTNFTPATSSLDLNTARSTYMATLNSMVNSPGATNGIMFSSFVSANFGVQMLHFQSSEDDIRVRHWNNGTAFNWIRLASREWVTAQKFASLSANGFAARTGDGVYTARTITGSDSIEVTNGDGVSGNPVIKMKYAGTPAW